MAARPDGEPFPIIGSCFPPWSSRTAATLPPPKSSSASSRARAGCPLSGLLRATAFCRRSRSCSTSRSGSTRATRTAWPRRCRLLTRHSTTIMPVSGDWRARPGLAGARLAEGRPSHRRRGHQPRAGGRRGDRPDQADPARSDERCVWRVTVLVALALVTGAARRAGRRPRGVVGEGVLPPGGRGGRGNRRRLRAGDRQAGRARPTRTG